MSPPLMNIFCFSLFGGVAGLVVGHPADTIKVRQQSFKDGHGVLRALQTTLKFEGWSGLYKGMSFPLVSTGALSALFFGVYANTLRLTEQWQYGEHGHKSCRDSTSLHSDPRRSSWHISVFLSGCVGGLAASIIACPIDLIKIQMQSQTGVAAGKGWGAHYEPQHKGVLDCVRRLYQRQGVRGLYTGMYSMLLRDVPSYGLYMLSYEHTLCAVMGRNHVQDLGTLIVAGGIAGTRPILSSTKAGSDVVSYGVYMLVYESGVRSSSWNHIVTTIVSGGTAGAVSWALITPLDVVKSRIQADNIEKPLYNGVVDCFKKSYQEHGMPVFFRGFSMMMLRAFPVNAATFVVYEWSLRILRPDSAVPKS